MGQREVPSPPCSISARGLVGRETEQDLREAFEAFGPVASIAVHGSSCLVSFIHPEDAQKALGNRKVVVRATGVTLSVSPWVGQQQRASKILVVPRSLTNSWDISTFVTQVDSLLPDASTEREVELKRNIKNLLTSYSGFKIPRQQETRTLNMAARPHKSRGNHQPWAEKRPPPSEISRREDKSGNVWG